jgi:hypothetical protein
MLQLEGKWPKTMTYTNPSPSGIFYTFHVTMVSRD